MARTSRLTATNLLLLLVVGLLSILLYSMAYDQTPIKGKHSGAASIEWGDKGPGGGGREERNTRGGWGRDSENHSGDTTRDSRNNKQTQRQGNAGNDEKPERRDPAPPKGDDKVSLPKKAQVEKKSPVKQSRLEFVKDLDCSAMLPSGIITMDQYNYAKTTALHREVVEWWDHFTEVTKEVTRMPGFTWRGVKVTLDTITQWSRNYEYVYHYAALKAYVDALGPTENLKILDAGSGLTPFTFLASTIAPDAEAYALDVYPDYVRIFEALSEKVKDRGGGAKFVTDNLIKFDSTLKTFMFDIIHCVSVLEHTDQYENIVDNFYNHLNPGGVAIITFDINFSGNPKDTKAKMQLLYDYLRSRFGTELCEPSAAPYDFASMDFKAYHNTKWFCVNAPETLPWGGVTDCKRIPPLSVGHIVVRKPL